MGKSEPQIKAGHGEGDLRRRQAASQRAFYGMLAGGSSGARLANFNSIQATIVPVRPWFSIFNSVHYDDSAGLVPALPAIREAYEEAGVKAWTVWVPPRSSERPADTLSALGHSLDSSPMLMAAAIDQISLEPRIELELHPNPNWRLVAEINDRAHGVLEGWSMAAVFEDVDDPAAHLHVACCGSEPASALIAREHEGDCYFWFVATVPDHRHQGLAGELVRHALREARKRGCTTTTLESTRMAENVYEGLGFRPLGRYEMWERRMVA